MNLFGDLEKQFDETIRKVNLTRTDFESALKTGGFAFIVYLIYRYFKNRKG